MIHLIPVRPSPFPYFFQMIGHESPTEPEEYYLEGYVQFLTLPEAATTSVGTYPSAISASNLDALSSKSGSWKPGQMGTPSSSRRGERQSRFSPCSTLESSEQVAVKVSHGTGRQEGAIADPAFPAGMGLGLLAGEALPADPDTNRLVFKLGHNSSRFYTWVLPPHL